MVEVVEWFMLETNQLYVEVQTQDEAVSVGEGGLAVSVAY
jgi:hypothetical protein